MSFRNGIKLIPVHYYDLVNSSDSDSGSATYIEEPYVVQNEQTQTQTQAQLAQTQVQVQVQEAFTGFGMDQYLKQLEKALVASATAQVKAVLFSNPSNPLGRVATEQEIVQVIEFCKKHQLHLVVDEVYALSVYNHENAKYVVIVVKNCKTNY